MSIYLWHVICPYLYLLRTCNGPAVCIYQRHPVYRGRTSGADSLRQPSGNHLSSGSVSIPEHFWFRKDAGGGSAHYGLSVHGPCDYTVCIYLSQIFSKISGASAWLTHTLTRQRQICCLANSSIFCKMRNTCPEGKSFSENDKPDKATGWNSCNLSGFLRLLYNILFSYRWFGILFRLKIFHKNHFGE